jgi:hypothetical protein
MTVALDREQSFFESIESPLAKFILNAAGEINSCLQDTHRMKANSRLLYTLASGSPYSFDLSARKLLPALNVVWQASKLDSEKNLLLANYNAIIAARLEHDSILEELVNQPDHRMFYDVPGMRLNFSKFRNEIVEIYFSAVANINNESSNAGVESSLTDSAPNSIFGATAVRGLVMLARIKEFLSDAERAMVVQKLTKFALNSDLEKDIAGMVFSGLQEISAFFPELFEAITLPNFLERLPEKISDEPQMANSQKDMVISLLQRIVEISCTTPCRKELPSGPPPKAVGNFSVRLYELLQDRLLSRWLVTIGKEGQLSYANVILCTIYLAIEKIDNCLDQMRQSDSLPETLTTTINPYNIAINTVMATILREERLKVSEASSDLYIGLKPFIGEPQEEIVKLVQLAGQTMLLALRSKSTTSVNSFVSQWSSISESSANSSFRLFKQPLIDLANSKYDLYKMQADCKLGPIDKAWANLLSMYLAAGIRSGVCQRHIAISHRLTINRTKQ